MTEKSLDLHFFFEREQGASAFLATLLEQRENVRDAFFDMLADGIGQELADSFKGKAWQVRVEEDQVDIRLDSNAGGAWVILIENKLQAGAKQPGQLRRYYEYQIQEEPGARVVAVYLAPGAMGESEIEEVLCSEVFRQRNCDFAAHVSWDELLDYLRGLSRTDASGFIDSGVKEIAKTIEDAPKPTYSLEGERGEIHRVACRVREGLESRFPNIKISPPWPDKDSFILGSQGTDLTLYLVLSFDAEPSPPYAPVGLFEGQSMRLTVHSRLKLSAEGNRKAESKLRWRELLRDGIINVPGVGIHNLQGRWLVLRRELSATPDRIVNELTDMGASLLEVVKNWESGRRSATASQGIGR